MDGEGFDLADAALLGGVAGFVHESIQAEEEGLKESEFDSEEFSETVRDGVDRTGDVTIRLLYNENPGLVEFLVRKLTKERMNTSDDIIEKEAAEVRQEMEEELKRLEEEEQNG